MLIGISLLVCVLIVLSVLFVPEVKVGKVKLDLYWVIALVGAVTLLAFGFVDSKVVLDGIFANSPVNPIKILVLFVSMTGLSVFLDEVGFFRLAAQFALNKAKSSQTKLFLYLYITVSILTVFTSNDIIVLTFTPFICYFAKRANINPIPYLVAEFAAANTWSMALIIGNPTNIYIASSFQIDFVKYISVMLLPTICAGIVAFIILRLIFRKQLSQPLSVSEGTVTITSKALLIIGLAHLSLCTILLAISSYIGFDMWLISLGFFVSLMLFVCVFSIIQKNKATSLVNTIKRLPWQLIPFVLSMFVLVLALNGVTEQLGKLLNGSQPVFSFGLGSYLSANLINNIPMSVLFVFIIKALPESNQIFAVYSSIIGSNIGAYLTPIGALAGIMWTSILKELDVKFRFIDFVKYGIIVSVPTILTALLLLKVILS